MLALPRAFQHRQAEGQDHLRGSGWHSREFVAHGSYQQAGNELYRRRDSIWLPHIRNTSKRIARLLPLIGRFIGECDNVAAKAIKIRARFFCRTWRGSDRIADSICRISAGRSCGHHPSLCCRCASIASQHGVIGVRCCYTPWEGAGGVVLVGHESVAESYPKCVLRISFDLGSATLARLDLIPEIAEPIGQCRLVDRCGEVLRIEETLRLESAGRTILPFRHVEDDGVGVELGRCVAIDRGWFLRYKSRQVKCNALCDTRFSDVCALRGPREPRRPLSFPRATSQHPSDRARKMRAQIGGQELD